MEIIVTIIVYALPILLAVSLHETAHGWIAYLLGDSTAKDLGRLTANPFKHIDPIGTVAVPVAMYLVTQYFYGQGIPFGWAKPVPVEPEKFDNPQKDMALVAIAGPVANFIMAVGWALILVVVHKYMADVRFSVGLQVMAQVGIIVNLILMVLNMLPIPPLDGGRLLMGVIPLRWANFLAKYELVGFILLILLVIKFDLLKQHIMPMADNFRVLIFNFFGI